MSAAGKPVAPSICERCGQLHDPALGQPCVCRTPYDARAVKQRHAAARARAWVALHEQGPARGDRRRAAA